MLLMMLGAAGRVCAQETVFDVPSADILNKGQVYFEQDGTVRPVNVAATFTPRVVFGVGGSIEAGVNFNGLSAPGPEETVVSPTIKWRPWYDKDSGWMFYVGDDVFIPVHDRTYNAGNYAYASVDKVWASGTRIGFGAYDFTRDVVAKANRAGGEFTFEQPVTKKLTLAVEWYTGKMADGYVNPGVIFKLTPKITLYGAYQIGNAGVTAGNHMFLWEIGYNFN
ncbi:MAG TPA: hypothetical protein VL913_00875 [Candidatus Micrarchaeaceae archaeon]|nr:hypothetical protein [Candidatus Micrarchaeaceae archaeon]